MTGPERGQLRIAAQAYRDHPRRHTFEMAAQWATECSPDDVLSLLDDIDGRNASQKPAADPTIGELGPDPHPHRLDQL